MNAKPNLPSEPDALHEAVAAAVAAAFGMAPADVQRVMSGPVPRVGYDEYEIARALGVTVAFLRKDRQKERRLPYYKVGTRVLYDLQRVRETLSQMEVGGVDPRRVRRARAAA